MNIMFANTICRQTGGKLAAHGGCWRHMDKFDQGGTRESIYQKCTEFLRVLYGVDQGYALVGDFGLVRELHIHLRAEKLFDSR